MTDAPIKVTVTFERREDGGLRVWSEDLPGLTLSHGNVDAVLGDVMMAVEAILSDSIGSEVQVLPLRNLRETLENNGVIDPQPSVPVRREYVAYHAH